jgi:hypothetical protein
MKPPVEKIKLSLVQAASKPEVIRPAELDGLEIALAQIFV